MFLCFQNLPMISVSEMAERVFNGVCAAVHVQVYSFGLKILKSLGALFEVYGLLDSERKIVSCLG